MVPDCGDMTSMPPPAPYESGDDHRPGPGRSPREGVGLCLSGGGYRAALFHLGAVRRLNELGILGGLRTISSASGGAVVANLLADPRLRWPGERHSPDLAVHGFDKCVAEPLRRLAGRNVRTPALLSRLLPWRWFMPDSAVRALADAFAKTVPAWSRPLRENATDGPGIFTCATEVGYGVGWTFADPTAILPVGRVGDVRLGHADPPDWIRLADAVAASCAFPPFFSPLKLDGERLGLDGGHPGDVPPQVREAIWHNIRLADGGVYDELAVEPVWEDHAVVLVSGGGSVFEPKTEHTWWGRLLRIISIATSGGSRVRLRWLRDTFGAGVADGAAWALDAVVPGRYPDPVVERINVIRTDLDAFSTHEQQILERHGYFVADQAVHAHVPALIKIDAPLVDPHPGVADPDLAMHALRNSAHRTLFGHW